LAGSLKAGFSPAKALYAGPSKTPKQIEFALREGVQLLTAESVNQLKLIDQVAGSLKAKVKVLLRLNIPSLHNKQSESMMGEGSQFGIDTLALLENKEAILSLKNVELIGTQFYAASQILDPTRLAKSVRIQMETTKQLVDKLGIKMDVLDIGGGFGIPYSPSESPLDLQACAAEVREALKAICDKPTKIIVESGRFLVGDCGKFYTRVIDVKQSFGRHYIICDGGMVGFTRPVLVDSPHHIELFDTAADNPIETCNICGPSCSSVDCLGTVRMPVPEIGDIISIGEAGAYGWSMSIQKFHCLTPPKELVLPD
jgi:diaminopimelate decarboxylase